MERAPLTGVFCIIVGFHPDVDRVHRLCLRILGDGARVILVDNSTRSWLAGQRLPAGCELISLGYNSGLAHAQNVGVRRALQAGATVIVFFDQDSYFAPGFLVALTASLLIGTPEIVAPVYVDEATNTAFPSLRVNRFGCSKTVLESSARGRYPVDAVISSGTAATREVFTYGGYLDDSLFLDFADVEWCLRCRAKGIPIYVVPNAIMSHRIGAYAKHFGPFTVFVHNSTRCYYQIRNSFLLLRRPHVPILFSIRTILRVLMNRAVLLFFVESRFKYIKTYCFAVRDGCLGISGAGPSHELV